MNHSNLMLSDIMSISGFKRLQQIQKRYMDSPSSDEDHPNVREMRKRMVEIVRELDQENILGSGL